MQNYLIVVDMQTDFVDGALGTKEAQAIVPAVKKRIEEALYAGEKVIFTRDTHPENYLETQEGRNLPVKHCVLGTDGWQIIPELSAYAENAIIIDKPTFGSRDICVISNAMLVKAFLPEVPLVTEEACCAGVTPESHVRALEAMKVCQITVR